MLLRFPKVAQRLRGLLREAMALPVWVLPPSGAAAGAAAGRPRGRCSVGPSRRGERREELAGATEGQGGATETPKSGGWFAANLPRLSWSVPVPVIV